MELFLLFKWVSKNLSDLFLEYCVNCNFFVKSLERYPCLSKLYCNKNFTNFLTTGLEIRRDFASLNYSDTCKEHLNESLHRLVCNILSNNDSWVTYEKKNFFSRKIYDLTFKCIKFQNDQTNFKNLAAFAASVSGHFGTLCINGLNHLHLSLLITLNIFYTLP